MPQNPTNPQEGKNRFGTFSGVFTPSILTILGVIMFMRANFVVGQAGIIGAVLILLIAKSISLTTASSISAIATNIRMRGGGLYFLISRVLGAEFGGAIGIALFFALAISVPFYILGFSEALILSFPELTPHFQTINLCVALVLFIISYLGAKLAIKTQFFIMAFLLMSILAFLGGALADFSPTTFVSNLHADYTNINLSAQDGSRYTFWIVFAIYFPAVTGIAAGVNMSGDLRDPHHSIPLGTLAAVVVGFLVYLLQILTAGSAWTRDALIANPYGLLHENALFGWSPLVTAGVFAATLSSAISSYLGAPRILQALSRDRIIPALGPFAKGAAKSDEPRLALFLTLVITLGVLLWAGNNSGGNALNGVAALITMFFLYSYGMINLAAFIEDYSDNPSFRPEFRFYHWSTALFGALACAAVSFLINWVAALLAIALILFVLWYIRAKHFVATFGDARRGFLYTSLRENLIRLSRMTEDPKNWRPTVIAFSGNPEIRDILASYALWIASRHGIVFLAHILQGNFEELAPRRPAALQQLTGYCRDKNFPAFPVVVVASDLERGVKMILQGTNTGPVRPNLAMFGWTSGRGELLYSYIRQLRAAAILNMSLILLHSGTGLPQPEKKRRIDIWWRGQKNGNLMVLTAHLMSENWEWEGTLIRLLRVIESEEGKDAATEGLESLISEARINAVPAVLVSSDAFADVLHDNSHDATCVILGTEVPEEGQEDIWHSTYQDLLNDMPTTIIVNSRGEEKLMV